MAPKFHRNAFSILIGLSVVGSLLSLMYAVSLLIDYSLIRFKVGDGSSVYLSTTTLSIFRYFSFACVMVSAVLWLKARGMLATISLIAALSAVTIVELGRQLEVFVPIYAR